jgi:hypothetical protein
LAAPLLYLPWVLLNTYPGNFLFCSPYSLGCSSVMFTVCVLLNTQVVFSFVRHTAFAAPPPCLLCVLMNTQVIFSFVRRTALAAPLPCLLCVLRNTEVFDHP